MTRKKNWYEKQVIINPVYWSEKEEKSLKILIVHWRYLFSILVSDWQALFVKTYEGAVTSKMPQV